MRAPRGPDDSADAASGDIAPPAVGAGGNALKGILYMLLAVSMFPLLNASVKYLGAWYPTTEVIWARYAGHLVFAVCAFAPVMGWRLFRTQRLTIQVVRSLLLLSATSFYFAGLNFLPLATAATISFTSPFIVSALAAPVLGEKMGVRRWAAVVVGFLGTLIIIRPGFEGMHWAMLLILGSATSFALYQLLTRKIAASDDPRTSITYAALVGAAVASLLAPFDWRLPDEALHWLLFVAVGFFGGVGHFFVIKALEHAPATVLAPFSYGQLVGATLLGFLVFSEFPDLYTWIGAAIIVSAGIYITWRERQRRPA